MRRVRWLVTLEGVPLAFGSQPRIVEGEEAELDEEDVERALEAGLAVEVEAGEPAALPLRRGRVRGEG
jgi:hypothetical protein